MIGWFLQILGLVTFLVITIGGGVCGFAAWSHYSRKNRVLSDAARQSESRADQVIQRYEEFRMAATGLCETGFQPNNIDAANRFHRALSAVLHPTS